MRWYRLATLAWTVHNAVFHISNNIKAFAAARLGAAEVDSPGMREGLPTVEIYKMGPDGKRSIIARIDCVDGLVIVSDAEWMAMDNGIVQKVPCTKLVESLAEWLVFCRIALETKEDMALELLDPRTVIPLVTISDNGYSEAAPWVTTRIRYGGFLGFFRRERDVSLEELMQRVKVRTASGRRANRRAAKAQVQTLKTSLKEMADELKKKVESAERLKGNELTRAEKDIATRRAALSNLQNVGRVAKKTLKRLAKTGFLYRQRASFRNLHYIDPCNGSASRILYESSGGTQGWVKPAVLTMRESCYYLCWWPCKMQCW